MKEQINMAKENEVLDKVYNLERELEQLKTIAREVLADQEAYNLEVKKGTFPAPVIWWSLDQLREALK